MRNLFRFGMVFLPVILLGAIIGYNISWRSQITSIPMDLFDTLENHSLTPVKSDALRMEVVNKILAQLDSSAAITEIKHSAELMIPVQVVRCNLDSVSIYLKPSAISADIYSKFAKELDAAVSPKVERVVLDLRGTAGDNYDAAIRIADEFLSGDKLIAYAKSIHTSTQEFRAQRPGLYEEGRLELLVDNLTSGASEVICAAIKSWKRGLLIGTKTAGEALRKERFVIEDKFEITIPTLRYFSPDGDRLQKNFAENTTGGISPDSVVDFKSHAL
ncbi:S41 family peptidase [Niabella beijingensis]|uniref:S41 family peptidase n=1 Tax=Niabella beijingensis TaxID=2872700 RepID=UPI001CBBA5F2|nr:S41 family peptidase [Niabella beijingensis]MBZ4188112.1 S41 family peptidase [Niabella beijingensis]